MITNITLTAPDTYSADVDNTVWSGITETSRFWQDVQAAIAGGAAVGLPPEPTPDPKLTGVEFDGVMCSATGQDQNGLVALLLAIQMQGAAFPATRFWFDNGNDLIITTGNYEAFMAVWLPFRQSFYLAGVFAE
jgi:hypothetical protein